MKKVLGRVEDLKGSDWKFSSTFPILEQIRNNKGIYVVAGYHQA